MANKKIKSSDIVQPNLLGALIKEAKALEKAIDGIQDALKGNIKVQKEYIAVSKTKDFKVYKEEEKSIKAVKDSIDLLIDAEKQQEQVRNKISVLQKRQIVENEKEKLKLQELAQAQKIQLQLEQAAIGSMKRLTIETKKLILERNNLNLNTKEGQKRLQSINKELDLNNKIIKENSSALEKQKINVGNYGESIIGAARDSGIFGSALGGVIGALQQSYTGLMNGVNALKDYNASMALAGKNTGLFGSAITGLKTGGILALVAAIASLAVVLKKTEFGMEFLERQTAGVMAIFGQYTNLVGQLASGEFKEFLKALNNINNSTGKAYEQAVKYTKALQDLEDLERARIVTRAEEGRQISENRLELEDENKTIEDKLKLIEETIRLDEVSTENELFFLRKRRDILEDNIKVRKRDSPKSVTDADLKEVEDAKAAVINFETEQNTGRRRLASQREGLAKELAKEILDREIRNKERRIALIEDEYAREKELLILKYENIKREAIKNKDNLMLVRKNFDKELADLDKKKGKSVGDVDRMSIIPGLEATPESMKEQARRVKEQAEQIAKDLKDIQEKKDQEEKDAADEKAEFIKKINKSVTDALLDEIEKQAEAKINDADKDIERRKDNIQKQADLAARGLDNTLAFEKKKEAEAELAKELAMQQKIKNQKILAYYSLIAAYATSGDKSAAVSAFADIAIAEAASAFFWEGAENVGDALGNKSKAHNGRDGYRGRTSDGTIIGFDGKERILSGEQNKLIGDISNDALATMAYNTRMGAEKMDGVKDQNSYALLSELKKLNETISKKKEISVSWNSLDERVEQTVQDGMKKTVRYIRQRPRI